MASLCMPQTQYQQQQQQFIAAGNGMMMQQQLQQYTAAQQHPKVLGTSNLQNIQPAATSGFGPMATQKKKYTYLNMPYGEQMPSVARRNARERNRVKQVNNGFANLRQHLPQTVVNSLSNGGRGASKKLSKVDTLRIAVEYIRGLQDMLDGCDGGDNSATGTLLLDESSNDGSNYGYETRFPMAHSYNSEASASPTPSYSDSDISIGGANYLPPLSSSQQQQQQQQSAAVASNSAMQFKFEPFDSYNQFANDEEQADDEELLDYISSWQEQ